MLLQLLDLKEPSDLDCNQTQFERWNISSVTLEDKGRCWKDEDSFACWFIASVNSLAVHRLQFTC